MKPQGMSPEAWRERQRQYYAEHREARREQARKWRAANKDKLQAYKRRRYQEDPARQKQFAQAVRHGRDIAEAFTAMWRAQDGRCYLCCELLPSNSRQVHVDHDHSCCGPRRSCGYCRRGLACERCNTLIGRGADDPELLRKIADNLEAALADVRERIALKPAQGALL